MPAASETLTARQQAWMASVKANLVKETGRTLDQWAEIARTCPETRHRARLNWLKAEHGLGLNRASAVLGHAFPPEVSWHTPDALAATLWRDPTLRALFEAVKAEIVALPDVLIGQRKAYTAFSRGFQFAAMRPDKGAIALGLAVPPDAAAGLAAAPIRPLWSERLKSQARLASAADLDPLRDALRMAWEQS